MAEQTKETKGSLLDIKEVPQNFEREQDRQGCVA